MEYEKIMPFKMWQPNEIISYLQRRVLVFSVMYYRYNTSIISDNEYDKLCTDLVKITDKFGVEENAKSRYYEVFEDFDGSTGFDLASKLTADDFAQIDQIAGSILNARKGKV